MKGSSFSFGNFPQVIHIKIQVGKELLSFYAPDRMAFCRWTLQPSVCLLFVWLPSKKRGYIVWLVVGRSVMFQRVFFPQVGKEKYEHGVTWLC